MIFPGIFALTVAATRGVVLKAFRQIEERTPYDEEVQIKQESRRVLLAGVKGFTLLGVRRKVPKSAIFVCPGLRREYSDFRAYFFQNEGPQAQTFEARAAESTTRRLRKGRHADLRARHAIFFSPWLGPLLKYGLQRETNKWERVEEGHILAVSFSRDRRYNVHLENMT